MSDNIESELRVQIATLKNRIADLTDACFAKDGKLAEAEERVRKLEEDIRNFLSGAAPCDRGKMWPRKDVDELESALSAEPKPHDQP